MEITIKAGLCVWIVSRGPPQALMQSWLGLLRGRAPCKVAEDTGSRETRVEPAWPRPHCVFRTSPTPWLQVTVSPGSHTQLQLHF